MKIQEIDKITFDNYAQNHILKNFYQTKEYGDLMEHSDFSSMYIGGFANGVLVAASLILYKNIASSMKYGYAPRGFLINYYDYDLVLAFTKGIKEFFFKRGFVFLKINPEVAYSLLDYNSKSKTINPKSSDLVTFLKKNGYDKLKDNLYFESMLPKYTPIIKFKDYDINSLDNSVLNNANDCEFSGINIVSGTYEDLERFYPFINDVENRTLTYYQYLYNTFSKNNMIDLLLVKLNHNLYIKYLQKKYIYEQENNEKINEEFHNNPRNMDAYNKKMKSDELIAELSADIVRANEKINEEDSDTILGGAIVIKYKGRVTILVSGNTYEYRSLDIKSYIYYKIIEEYKKAGYLFLDLNGITADFSDTNPYKDLNDFKLKFKPNVFEYIGEFDLVVNKPFHQLLWSTNKIQNEFYKPSMKKN